MHLLRHGNHSLVAIIGRQTSTIVSLARPLATVTTPPTTTTSSQSSLFLRQLTFTSGRSYHSVLGSQLYDEAKTSQQKETSVKEDEEEHAEDDAEYAYDEEVDENAIEDDAEIEEMEAAEIDEGDWSEAAMTEEDVHDLLHWMSPNAQQRRLQSIAAQDAKFAVVQLAGKQYRVANGDKIVVQSHFPKEVVPGTQIVLNKILLVGGKDFTVVGRPMVTCHGATVLATVEEMTRARKLIVFKMKRRKRYRRWKIHRQLISVLNVDEVQFNLPAVDEQSEKIVAVE